jgi:hypothetical protein
MQYDIAKQDVHTITVNCVCPVGVHGISDFEVFVHENEHRLVIKLGENITHVPLVQHCGCRVMDPEKVRARYVKKKGMLMVTIPVVPSASDTTDKLSCESLSRSLSIKSNLMEFPSHSPVRIEIRPLPTGRCIVAARKIIPGEIVLLEEPFALLRLGQGDESAPPTAQTPEWQLTRVLCPATHPPPPAFCPPFLTL